MIIPLPSFPFPFIWSRDPCRHSSVTLVSPPRAAAVLRHSRTNEEVRRGSRAITLAHCLAWGAAQPSVRLIGGLGAAKRRLAGRRASDGPQHEVWQADARHCRAADAAVAGPRAAAQAAKTGDKKGAGVGADGGCAAPRPPVSARMHICTPIRAPTASDQLLASVSDGCIHP